MWPIIPCIIIQRKGVRMGSLTNSSAPLPCGCKRIVPGLLAGALALAVAVLGVVHFGSDLSALWDGRDEAAVVAGGPSLPIDGPAVTMARVREQEVEGTKALNKAAAANGVLQFDEWTYTQATGKSPFLFDPPGSFDFFNPLFAFNFGGLTPQQLFGLFFAEIFGLPNAGPTMVPVFMGAPPNPMVVAPISTTTTTFPDGTTVTTTLFSTRSLLPMQLGLVGRTHRTV